MNRTRCTAPADRVCSWHEKSCWNMTLSFHLRELLRFENGLSVLSHCNPREDKFQPCPTYCILKKHITLAKCGSTWMLSHPRGSSRGLKGKEGPVDPCGAHRDQRFEAIQGSEGTTVSEGSHFLMSLKRQIFVYNLQIDVKRRRKCCTWLS